MIRRVLEKTYCFSKPRGTLQKAFVIYALKKYYELSICVPIFLSQLFAEAEFAYKTRNFWPLMYGCSFEITCRYARVFFAFQLILLGLQPYPNVHSHHVLVHLSEPLSMPISVSCNLKSYMEFSFEHIHTHIHILLGLFTGHYSY